MSLRRALPAADPDRTAWRGVAALALTETVSWGVLYYAFGVLLGPLHEHLQTSEAVVAGAFSLALFTAGLASAPVGRAIDRWGVRRVMTVASIGAAVGFSLTAATHGIAALYAVWALVGVGQAGVLYEPAFAAITGWFRDPKERSRALLAVTTLAGFASTIFVPATAALCTRLGWRGAVLALGVLFASVVIPLHASLPSADRRAHDAHHDATATTSHPEHRRNVAVLSVVFALYAFASTGAALHLVSHLRAGGLDLARAAQLAGIAGASQVGGRRLYPTFRRALGPAARLPALLAVQACALAAIAGTAGVPLVAGIVAFGAANGLVTLERATMVADWFGRERYATVNGRIAGFALTARAAAPIAIGLVRERGAHATAFLLLALLLVIASISFPLMHGTPPREA